MAMLFLSNEPPFPHIYTLSLHDALPIFARGRAVHADVDAGVGADALARPGDRRRAGGAGDEHGLRRGADRRSEEHTSELQSRRDLVCRLLLEKKKTRRSTDKWHYGSAHP